MTWTTRRASLLGWALIGVALLASCAVAPLAQPGADALAEARLVAVLDALQQLEHERDPQLAAARGERRFERQLEDASLEAAERYRRAFEALAVEAAALDPDQLSVTSRESRALVLAELARVRAAEVCRSERWSVDPVRGPQHRLVQLLRRPTELAVLEAQLAAAPASIAGRVEALRAGVASGHVPSRANVERVLAQLDAWLDAGGEEEVPTWLDAAAWGQVSQWVARDLRPALVSYRDVLRDEVLPAAREAPGVHALPDGAACYAAQLEAHLGPGHTPDALHALGRERVAAAQARLAELGRAVLALPAEADASAVRAALVARLTAEDDGQQLIAAAQAAYRRADAALLRVVTRLPPEAPVGIEAMSAAFAAHGTLGAYQGSGAGGRFYLNTQQGSAYAQVLIEALTFHETVPGHHLQAALAASVEGLHPWRRRLEQTAFVEGWALYAEGLAQELGLYSGPLAEIGAAELEAWRAARLVVDTGVHHLGWSRDEAIDYLVRHTWLSEPLAASEVDRYAAMPGQALGYVVGREAIVALRAREEARLGDGFELRAFHDALLARGPLPLALLESLP